MAIKRVTMQDIADACGLSRNTVSKVFNGRGSVPPATRDFILKKAGELGYGLPVKEKEVPSVQSGGSIALLTNNMPVDYHFGTFFVTTFTDQICRAGYTPHYGNLLPRKEIHGRSRKPEPVGPHQLAA